MYSMTFANILTFADSQLVKLLLLDINSWVTQGIKNLM